MNIVEQLNERRQLSNLSVDLSFVHFVLAAINEFTDHSIVPAFTDYLGCIALVVQTVTTSVYWGYLGHEIEYEDDPTRWWIDVIVHGGPLIPLTIQQVIAPEDFNWKTIAGTFAFGLSYLITDFIVATVTGTPAYDFLDWNDSFFDALQFGATVFTGMAFIAFAMTFVW